jgi:hypothetical protein
MLGLQVEAQGRRIIGISPPAVGMPVQPGDILIAVNAIPVPDGTAFGAVVGEVAAAALVTVTVEQDRGVYEFDIACRDRDVWRRKLIEGIDLALSGRYDECRKVMRELDIIAGPRTGHAKLRYECAQGDRIARGRARSLDDALLYTEIYRRLATPARFSRTYWERVRVEVEDAAERLRMEGFGTLAAQLGRLLEIPAERHGN